MKASFPRHMSGGNRGDEVCLFVVCCLFVCLLWRRRWSWWKLVSPGTCLEAVEGVRFVCLLFVCCLLICLLALKKKMKPMKASFPRHMSGGGPGLARLGPRRPANTRQSQHQLKPANSPKRSSYQIFFGQSAAWCEASIFLVQHDKILNWDLLSIDRNVPNTPLKWQPKICPALSAPKQELFWCFCFARWVGFEVLGAWKKKYRYQDNQSRPGFVRFLW